MEAPRLVSSSPHPNPLPGGEGTVASCFQQLTVAQRALERRLHLHLAELPYGEIEVLDRGRSLVREVVEQELGQAEAGKGDLGAETHFLADFEGLEVVVAGFVGAV